MWELKFNDELYSLKAGRTKGRADPEWVVNAPILEPGQSWFIRAYWDLASERPASAQAVSRVPWSKAMQYGAHHGLREPMLSVFWKIIAALDGGYMEFMQEKHDAAERIEKRKAARAAKAARSTN